MRALVPLVGCHVDIENQSTCFVVFLGHLPVTTLKQRLWLLLHGAAILNASGTFLMRDVFMVARLLQGEMKLSNGHTGRLQGAWQGGIFAMHIRTSILQLLTDALAGIYFNRTSAGRRLRDRSRARTRQMTS